MPAISQTMGFCIYYLSFILLRQVTVLKEETDWSHLINEPTFIYLAYVIITHFQTGKSVTPNNYSLCDWGHPG